MEIDVWQLKLMRKHSESIELFQKLEYPDFDCDIGINIWSDFQILIFIKDFNLLHNCREYLRKQLGGWEDRLIQVWASSNEAHVSWNGLGEYDRFSIRFSCNVESFPKELLPTSDCHFEEVTRTEKVLVCPVSKQTDL